MKRISAAALTVLLLFLSACRVHENEKIPSDSEGSSVISESEEKTRETETAETAGSDETSENDETSAAETEESGTTEGSAEESSAETEAPSYGHLFASDTLCTDSDAYCALDDSGMIIIGRNEFERREPASITKVLTALIIAENYLPDNEVTVTEKDVTEGIDIMSSGVYPSLKPDEVFTVKELLMALILPSTNAAGNVLANYAAGSTEAFAGMMNEKAASLGLTHSHFSNPHGLHSEDHYTCAYDMAVILKAAMENPLTAEILGMSECVIPETAYSPARYEVMGHAMLNGNYDCPGVIGGKSGYTAYSGNTLVTAAERDGKRLYVCTMHSDEELSYADTANVISYACACLNGTVPDLMPIAHDAAVTDADETGVNLKFHIGNPAATARIVYWNMVQGPERAQEIRFNEPPEAIAYHLDMPEPATYVIQFFAGNADGKENVIGTSILNCGAVYEPGIVRWNGQDYVIGARGFLRINGIETADGCYYTNQDGAIGHGFVGGRFYAGEDGKIMTGWIEVNGERFYCQADGRIATGARIVDGVLHHFSETGAQID